MIKAILGLIGLAFAAILLVLFAVSRIENRQARLLEKTIPYSSQNSASASGTAIVYFSRSGNTALAARHVAQRLGSPLIAIEAPDYELGLSGLTNALKDAHALKATAESLPDIEPSNVDLTAFSTVWLGSPVWLYSPAPPLWAFVENNRFDGQHVVLFNTFNSHVGDDHIAAFKAKVMARGAKSFEHRGVLRGRMTQQLTPEQMLEKIDAEWFRKDQ
jgi:flavodoxin